MVWVIVGDGDGAIYPTEGGNFVFTYLMYLSICCFFFFFKLYFYKLVEFEKGKVKTA